MDETHLIYKPESPVTLERFVDKSKQLNEIVQEAYPDVWKDPFFMYVFDRNLYRLKLDKLNSKMNPLIWGGLDSISMFINGYLLVDDCPMKTYNLVSLSYKRDQQEIMLGAIWWMGKKSWQDVYEELFL